MKNLKGLLVRVAKSDVDNWAVELRCNSRVVESVARVPFGQAVVVVPAPVFEALMRCAEDGRGGAWVPVAERVPEPGVPVWVCDPECPEAGVTLALYEGGTWWEAKGVSMGSHGPSADMAEEYMEVVSAWRPLLVPAPVIASEEEGEK